MKLQLWTQLGDYRIICRIGGGAYGEVFEGEHVITRRMDAIKILGNGRPPTAEEEQRFLREIQVQAKLHHPNIAAVYNAFSTPHGPALVMELVQGEPLSAILARGRLPLQTGANYLLQVLAGMAYLHNNSVVHRDIKPENIIVTPGGLIKLTDFGLARPLTSPHLSQSGEFAGSPFYMSPEQAVGTTAADARSDIYSAGVILYEIATGRPPFQGDTSFALMLAHQTCDPQPPIELQPSIGPELNQVILVAMSKDPAQRYQTAAEFQKALEKVFTSDALKRPEPPASEAVRQYRRLVLATGLAAMAGVATAVAITHHGAFPVASTIRRLPLPGPRTTRSEPPPGAAAAPAPIATAPAPPMLPATPPPEPSPVEPPTAASSQAASGPVRPVKPQPHTAHKSAPAPALATQPLRINGAALDPAWPASASKPASETLPPAPTDVTPTAPEPAPTPPELAKALAESNNPDGTPKTAAPKRHGAFVRALQKVFGSHPPAKPDPAKQP